MQNVPDDTPLADRLWTHVDRLAGLIGPRHLGEPQRLEAAATLIERELTTLDYKVFRQTYPVGDQEAVNLIAELKGRRRVDEIIVLGAHYDTVPETPGADDNASAVAVMIEVARLLRASAPSRTVRFVAFSCEEPPHFYTSTMGSQVYARACRVNGERIVGMLCLEMVGYYTDAPGSQRPPEELPKIIHWALPRRGGFLAAVGNLRSWKLGFGFRRGFKRAVRFPLFSIALPERLNVIRLSDNSSFWDQGYPALMLTDTSFLRNPHYHQPSDLPDTLDYDCMAQVTYGVAGGVAYLSGAAFRRPR
jgi:Zn-dependent M28 family amino/carboxypeptidase